MFPVALTLVAASLELWFNRGMNKQKAIDLLGGSVSAAADAVGVSYQAVDKWPDVLPQRIVDRVQAAIARKHLPAEMLGLDKQPPAQEAAHG